MSHSGGSPGRSDGVAKMSAKDLFEQRKKYSNSNVIMHETSQYHVQHLATFIMDKSEAIVTVDDAIRKLVQLSAKEKIWAQEVLLQVNEKELRLLDVESKEELENFPLPTVRHSQTVLNQLRYPSVLLLVCQDSEQSKPDVHFFHCDEVEAELVHEDIESALADCRLGKKMRPQTLKGHHEKLQQRRSVLPGPQSPAPIPVQRSGGDSIPKNRVGPPAPLGDAGFRRRESLDEEPRAVLAHKIEKETQILNSSLDDIEWFVARLQKAAEAFKQLNQRKKGKRKGKKGPAEGVLTLRARPPAEVEFVDCFQKIKLAINLLAKLQQHIQNPSAVELVHFLFGPLELIISTCAGPHLAASAHSPLLSSEAVAFLQGHLTPKEMSLWKTMGEAWTVPRSDWPRESQIPFYVPRFRSGWEPPLDILQEAPWETEGLTTAPCGPEPAQVSRPSFRNSTKQHLASEPTPLGDVPPVSTPNPPRGYEPAPATTAKYARVLYDFTARNANELSVLKDEVLEVVKDGHQWWELRSSRGEVGYVPCNILDEARPEDAGRPPEQSSAKYWGPASPTHKLPPSISGPKNEVMDEVNNELQIKIHNIKSQPQRNFRVERSQPVRQPLTFDSTPEQVHAWLEAKAFSPRTVEYLGILTGPQLFSLTREELKVVCGEEGARVYSQLTVQKASMKDNKGGSELQELMDKLSSISQKQRMEEEES